MKTLLFQLKVISSGNYKLKSEPELALEMKPKLFESRSLRWRLLLALAIPPVETSRTLIAFMRPPILTGMVLDGKWGWVAQIFYY